VTQQRKPVLQNYFMNARKKFEKITWQAAKQSYSPQLSPW
jgi:hypothetical protein